MKSVGRVEAIWRYPAKSMQGEALTSAQITESGILGDRTWAIRDETSQEIRGAKKFPLLMQCKARYLGEVSAQQITDIEIILPDGRVTRTSDKDVNARLTETLQTSVSIHALRPASDVEHYRRRIPLTEDELRDILGREADEALPDLTELPQDLLSEIVEFTSPRGTYFDAYPIHLLTTSWLTALGEKNPQSTFSPQRFRPNILIDGAPRGFAELDWCGKHLKIGENVFNCQIPTLRCGMTTHATGELPTDRQVLRTIVRESDQNVGCYATLENVGEINVGDEVKLYGEEC